MAVTIRRERPADELSGSAPPAHSNPGAPAQVPDRQSTFLAVLVLAVLGVGLALSAFDRGTMPFGDSHDGRNAGVWAENSRSLRQQGPVASRLGTRALVEGEFMPYATHPPMIAVEAAAAETVFGERAWATRLPAWAGSLAAVVLAFLLLRECRLRHLAAAAGVALGFGCPMFATYGTMLDTPMVGLPFGIAVLWLWQRGRSGRPAPTPVVVLVAVLAALTSWLGLLTVALVGAAVLLPSVRRRLRKSDERSSSAEGVPAAGFVVGAVLGAALVFLWILWAYGSLGPLVDQFLVRTGDRGEGGGRPTLAQALGAFWPQVFTPWQLLLAVPAVVAALRWRPTRAVSVVTLVGMAVWIGGFRDGAIIHDYWAYWMVVPLALGFGVMADAVLRALQRRDAEASPTEPSSTTPRSSRAPLGRMALAGCSAALALGGVAARSGPGANAEAGQDAGALLAAADYPGNQRRAWVLMSGTEVFSWVRYQTGLPMAVLRPADLDALAATAPTELVLAGVATGPPSGSAPSAACLPAGSVQGGYTLVPASVLLRALQPDCG